MQPTKKELKAKKKAERKQQAEEWANTEKTLTNRKLTMFVLASLIGGIFLANIFIERQPVQTVEKPVEKVVTKEVTPSSCKEIIELDNNVLRKTGDALGDIFNTAKMNSLTQFVVDQTPTRTALATDCLSK